VGYDANKAARVNYYLKQGLSEDEAFAKAGIPTSDDAYYSIDGVKNSPTYGQAIAGPAAERPVDPSIKVMSASDKAEIKAREAREAEEDRKLKAKEEADDAAARAREEAEDRESAAREKSEASKQAALDQAQVNTNARDAGPSNTRTTNTVTTTGGGETTTKMTPEYREYLDKRGAADTADAAATQAAKDEYLRSKGLDQSTPAEKRKALREAEASGTSFESTANKDAVGGPPPNQYTTTTIPSTTNTESTVNDGTQTEDQAAKESAKGQTAAAAVDNTTPKEIPGEGTVAPDAATVTDEEADKIKNNEKDSEKVDELPEKAFPAPPPSESKIADASTKKSESAKQNSIVGATSNSTQTAVVDKNNNEKQKELSIKLAKARTNKLHDYTSSTYRTTMYLLSAEDYANLVAKPTTFNPKYALISSGGGFPNPPAYDYYGTLKTGRHPDFQEDFFFEQLSMTTVVGLNSKSKASNAIEINFTIVEPYGMTLLDRLMSACSMPPVNSNNYIDQPYLLEVDFLANVDEANKELASSYAAFAANPTGIRIDRKRIAIKIIEMKIKPGASGTEYKCRAIPYNHVAFQDTIASMPITLNVQADTLGKFFDSESEISKMFSTDVEKNEERIESELKKWIEVNSTNSTSSYTSGSTKPTPSEIEAQRNKIKASLTYTTDSFPAAYNTYMRGIAGKGKTFTHPPSLIAINIPDPDMKKSRIVDEKSSDAKATPMTNTTEGINASVRNAILKDGKTKQGFPISPGTNIVQLIDRVMQSSEYITKQVKEAKDAIARSKEIIANRSSLINDPSGDAVYKQQLAKELRDAEIELKRYKFLNWYKIIPQIFLLDFDKSRNAYSKQAIYTIQPYKAANAYHPDFDKTRINKSKIVRSYNYLYTGLNQDIVSIDIDFDSSFYTAITAFQDSKSKTSSKFESGANENNIARDADPKAANPTREHDLPNRFETQGSNATSSGQMNRASNDKSYAVSDIANSIYTSQRGDMLNVSLRIVGDPAFIKQDDIYYNPMSPEYKDFNTQGAGTEETVPLNPNTGQIIFDQEQVFVQLIIKSAVDIDDATGITNKQIKLSNGRMTDSTFSGVYKVLTVKSDFNRGKFEQTLTLVKMPNDLFFDDTVPKSAGANVIKPTVAKTEDPPASKPPAQPNENIAQDTTNQSAAETNRLKEAAAQPATNPVATSPGEGTVATAPQPADAAPANANDAQAVAPQEKALADQLALIDQYKAEYETVVEQRNQVISNFNTQATAIENDSTLSKAEQDQQLIALREQAKTDIQAYATKSTEIFMAVYKIDASGTDAFVPQNSLLKRINVFTAQAKSDFQRQDAKIASLKGTA
jgi:hypothetical protein